MWKHTEHQNGVMIFAGLFFFFSLYIWMKEGPSSQSVRPSIAWCEGIQWSHYRNIVRRMEKRGSRLCLSVCLSVCLAIVKYIKSKSKSKSVCLSVDTFSWNQISNHLDKLTTITAIHALQPCLLLIWTKRDIKIYKKSFLTKIMFPGDTFYKLPNPFVGGTSRRTWSQNVSTN